MKTKTLTFHYQEVRSAYIEMYGEFYDESEFESFEDAFKIAWDSFDFISNATDPYEVAEGMTECSQLQNDRATDY